MSDHYDVIVIGAGPGGYVAALRLAQLHKRVACVDSRETLGGTCLNVGCIPSKALLHVSQLYYSLKDQGENLGIETKGLTHNFTKMMRHKEEVVGNLVNGVAGLFERNKITWVKGKARLEGSGRISVGDKKLTADSIILATGSVPIDLPFLPIDEEKIITSTGALELKKCPKKLAVIGAGVIGVELASVYKRLGSEVTVLEMLDVICPAMDHTASKTLQQSLKRMGINFQMGVKVTNAEKKGKGVTLTYLKDGEEKELVVDNVLVAVGRKPYHEGLGLKEAGVTLNERGFVSVDNAFETSLPGVYAIGDLIEGPMLAHRASEEGIAVAELIGDERPKLDYIAIPNVIYTHPEVACVGLTEKEAKAAGLDIFVGSYPFKANPRALCTGETDGMVKVVGEKKTGKLIGMHIVSSNASEMIGEGVIALENGTTVEELAKASHAHPTLSEAIKEAALNALGKTLHL